MPTQPIQVPGQGSAPFNYQLAPSLEVVPRSIRAVFDGTSAVMSFAPCLVVLDPNGNEVGRFPTGTSVAAGGSAEVTWFPGHGVGDSGSTQALIGARIQAGSTQSIPNSTNTDLVYQSVFFDTDGMANLASDARVLTVNTAGIYIVIAETLWVYDGTGEGRRINTVVQNGFYSSGSIPDQFFSLDDRPANFAPVGGDGFGAPRTTSSSTGLFEAAVGDFFSSGGFQSSGGSLNCNGHANCFLSAVLVGS